MLHKTISTESVTRIILWVNNEIQSVLFVPVNMNEMTHVFQNAAAIIGSSGLNVDLAQQWVSKYNDLAVLLRFQSKYVWQRLFHRAQTVVLRTKFLQAALNTTQVRVD